MRRRPVLTSLLAALLLLQWGTAFAHCLQLGLKLAPAEAFALEICTPDGIHRVVLEDEGGERKALPAAVCPACLGPAAFALPPPPVALAAPVQLAQSADPPPAPPSSPRPAPTPHCQPRAPPTT
ncbi:hypothetical protein [Falsiroseomonas sp. HW251]|uniref:hypothetical protein n=1 Tax=Falsiroseomonas sp. HW251 TaxID=3390998 RepID=UPI003D310FEA